MRHGHTISLFYINGVVIPTNDMHSDITTLESQLKVIKDYRKLLCRELKAAIRIFNQLNKKERAKAFGVVNEVNHIRRQIYEKALGCGYVKQCIDSISVCKGECCKWHFPKKSESSGSVYNPLQHHRSGAKRAGRSARFE